MTDEDKNRADSLIAIHNTQMDHFRQTRDIQWKANLALWTLLVLAAKFFYGTIKLNEPFSRRVFAVVAVIIVFAHMFLWLMPVQNSLDTDDHWIRQYRAAVEELSKVTLKGPKKKKCCLWRMQKRLRKDGWSWILFQVSITALILAAVGIVLAHKLS